MSPERLAELAAFRDRRGYLTRDMGDELLTAAKEGIEAREDAERLDFAEANPVAVYGRISAQWADCGCGCRETFFGFRHAIDAARAK